MADTFKMRRTTMVPLMSGPSGRVTIGGETVEFGAWAMNPYYEAATRIENGARVVFRDGKVCPLTNTTQEPVMQTKNGTELKAYIPPTVGRVVLFHSTRFPQGPLAATIACVHEGGRFINVGYLTPQGQHLSARDVPLIQPGESPCPYDPYCTWMDYQLGQAQKVAQVVDEHNAKMREYMDKLEAAQKG